MRAGSLNADHLGKVVSFTHTSDRGVEERVSGMLLSVEHEHKLKTFIVVEQPMPLGERGEFVPVQTEVEIA